MILPAETAVVQLQGLLGATAHEPRLKGPFPVRDYSAVLGACQRMLDLLTSIQHMTTHESWYTRVRETYVIPVNKERRQMVRTVQSSQFRDPA